MRAEKIELTDQDIAERGVELAHVCRELEAARTEKKKQMELHNTMIKALEQHQSELKNAILQRWEEREIEDQPELPLGLPEMDGEVEHQDPLPYNEVIVSQPGEPFPQLPDLSSARVSLDEPVAAAPPEEGSTPKKKARGKKAQNGEVAR